MTKVIILSQIRELNQRIDEEIEYYKEKLDKAQFRLSMINEEIRQLNELLDILEKERTNNG